jgi:adenylate kinase
VAQAEELAKIAEIDCVVNINVPLGDLLERAVGRRICKSCGATYHIKYNAPKVENICDKCSGELYQRADDNEETLKTRLANYEKSTIPLIEYYKARGKYIEIDGRKPIKEVTAELLSKLRGA